MTSLEMVRMIQAERLREAEIERLARAYRAGRDRPQEVTPVARRRSVSYSRAEAAACRNEEARAS